MSTLQLTLLRKRTALTSRSKMLCAADKRPLLAKDARPLFCLAFANC